MMSPTYQKSPTCFHMDQRAGCKITTGSNVQCTKSTTRLRFKFVIAWGNIGSPSLSGAGMGLRYFQASDELFKKTDRLPHFCFIAWSRLILSSLKHSRHSMLL